MKRFFTQLTLLVGLFLTATTAWAQPVEFTEDPNLSTTQWYYIQAHQNNLGDWYLNSDFCSRPAELTESADYQWCFVKRTIGDIYMYNKAMGYWYLNGFGPDQRQLYSCHFLTYGQQFYINIDDGYLVFFKANCWNRQSGSSGATAFSVTKANDPVHPSIEADESEVTLLRGIRSTGQQVINTEYTHKANTRIEMRCKVADNHDRNWEALFGARLGSYQNNAFVFFSRTDGKDVPCYNRSGKEPRGSDFVYNKPVFLSFDNTRCEWSLINSDGTVGDPVGSQSHEGTADDGKTPMFIFDLNTAHNEGGIQEDNSKSVMTLYSFKIYEGNTLVREYVPAEYQGVVGLYERKTKRFTTTLTGMPFQKVDDIYNVLVNSGEGGNAYVDKTSCPVDDYVTVTVIPAKGNTLSNLSVTTVHDNTPVELMPLVGVNQFELLKNGACNGTFNYWEYSFGTGLNWSIGMDEDDGTYYWASSYLDCWLLQSIILENAGIYDDAVDAGDCQVVASAEMKASWGLNGLGSTTARVRVFMYDENGKELGVETVLDDLGVYTEWKSFTKTFNLIPGTRQLNCCVEGRDARMWDGNFGPCFRNLSLLCETKTQSMCSFAMPEDDVTVNVSFSPASAIDQPTLSVGKSSGAVYDLSGRRVNSSQLRPGIYIRNGKKFVVK